MNVKTQEEDTNQLELIRRLSKILKKEFPRNLYPSSTLRLKPKQVEEFLDYLKDAKKVKETDKTDFSKNPFLAEVLYLVNSDEENSAMKNDKNDKKTEGGLGNSRMKLEDWAKALDPKLLLEIQPHLKAIKTIMGEYHNHELNALLKQKSLLEAKIAKLRS